MPRVWPLKDKKKKKKPKSSSTCVLQEPDLPVDDEMIMLRCMETFDDEDL